MRENRRNIIWIHDSNHAIYAIRKTVDYDVTTYNLLKAILLDKLSRFIHHTVIETSLRVNLKPYQNSD
jgi:hypothetical protein